MVRDGSFFANVPDAVVQWESGQLANEGERILLHNPSGMVVDFVQYEPAAPWPIPSAQQESLLRISADRDNHFASSWQLEVLNNVAAEAPTTGALGVYPNPASDRIQLTGLTSTGGVVRAEVWSVSGQRVLDAHWAAGESTVLNVSGLAQGLYVLRSDNQRTTFVIQ